jgi:hypothetical protein
MRLLAAEKTGLQLQGIAPEMYSPSTSIATLVLHCTEPQYHFLWSEAATHRARKLFLPDRDVYSLSGSC